ncbi:CdaR family transcriptional regulator [Arthrobacter sp. ISL-5]|uniref:PucR family transcriptional regulator n=1 Tax=Arthrobacter sp. ISL-5 TaxID=2819111 RepID=UPI001BEA7ABD|nr:helix-turn-helix domain-containing protein [Arthrobacter sp. ISL-5]MBT2554155.1 helix-turn-helix domain-containing protein [Arthrobacter sp. ISL-5]
MEDLQDLVSLDGLISALGDTVRIVPTGADTALISVRTASFWQKDVRRVGSETLLVLPYAQDPNAVESLRRFLTTAEPQTLALCGWPSEILQEIPFAESRHAILRAEHVNDAVTIVSVLSRLTQPASVAELRRLTALQRSFSQALEHADAIEELLRRLQKVTNAVCLVLDNHGRVRESTGSLPLSLFLEQVRKTEASSQHVSVEGWEGLAIRLKDSDIGQRNLSGWLIVAARRTAFPNTQEAAAAHIVATLVEAARRMQASAEQQETAIRASIFDEALALRSKPQSPELTSRLGALGIDIQNPLRVVVSSGRTRDHASPSPLHQQRQQSFKLALTESDTAYLVTSRDSAGVYLVQANAETITRLIRISREALGPLIFGIGREIHTIGDISDSYADALIAIRTIQAGRHGESQMAFEQFDFATRVFASAGLETIVQASRSFLAPLLEREPMLHALRQYFENSQNINSTADALGIHHNTLRYRLGKVEELLELKLSDPASIASLFLALTSLELVELSTRQDKLNTVRQGTLGNDEGITRTGISTSDIRHASEFTATKPPGQRSY